MLIKEVQLRDYPYLSRKGLAERLARRYFERNGYDVFRGYAILRNSINYHKYENVRKKYDRLERILLKRLGLCLYLLREELGRGIPDFFLYRKDDNNCLFAEVKLEHEQIKPHQFACMKVLEEYGFKVIVLRMKSKIYRAEILLHNGDRRILVKQEKLRKKY